MFDNLTVGGLPRSVNEVAKSVETMKLVEDSQRGNEAPIFTWTDLSTEAPADCISVADALKYNGKSRRFHAAALSWFGSPEKLLFALWLVT